MKNTLVKIDGKLDIGGEKISEFEDSKLKHRGKNEVKK